MLAGVLRGCGRQKIGAIINLVMYWGIGLPFSCVLAFRMGLGAMGLWTGLACTASLQVRAGGCVGAVAVAGVGAGAGAGVCVGEAAARPQAVARTHVHPLHDACECTWHGRS